MGKYFHNGRRKMYNSGEQNMQGLQKEKPVGRKRFGLVVDIPFLHTLLIVATLFSPLLARAQSLPRLTQQQGRTTLIVDDGPFFVLGAQVDNSSGWPNRLSAVWPAAELLRLNTLEVPVYWEQIEPAHGSFDFGVVDAVLEQARQHKTHLILLWFGTWKNGKMHYVPDWVKSDTQHYPRMMSRAGVPIDVLSPNAPANLEADSSAFVALMRHLKQVDSQHTVITMQVENESGSLGLVRDFSPTAQALFDAAVPSALVRALNKKPGTWTQVFGEDADETFAAWSVSQYINAVAAAGKKELPLPMYVNNWLKSPRAFPITTIPGEDCPSGGPTINMLPIWKATAPAIDLIAPDIYVPNSERYRGVMRDFHQANNPLMIPESLGFEPFPGASGYARYLFYALDEGAIGFANFGLDRLHIDEPLSGELLAQIEGFRLLGSFDRELAILQFDGKIRMAVEEDGISQKEVSFVAVDGPAWRAVVSFPPSYDPPASPVSTTSDTKSLHVGRAVIASLGQNQFLVGGIDCRVQFALPVHGNGKQAQMLKVEEGHYNGTTWVITRLWNGDETDYGLNFGGTGTLLRVTMGTF
jgi:beta-galactosidase GanA